MQSVLRMYDRTTHTLMQLQAGDQTAPGNVREHWPVAKLISHDELREMGAKKREQIKNQKTSAASGKEVEFSWAIGENDLGHRLKKIRQFFEEGRKVDVTLSFSKRNRAVTEKECEDLLAKLRRVLGAVDGAREFKEPEGKIGKLYTMYWEAKKKKG